MDQMQKVRINDEILLKDTEEYCTIFEVEGYPALFVRSEIFCIWVCSTKNFRERGEYAFPDLDYLKQITKEFGLFLSSETIVTVKGFYEKQANEAPNRPRFGAKILPLIHPISKEDLESDEPFLL